MAAPRNVVTQPAPGCFFETKHPSYATWGVAKLIEVSNGYATLDYFDSPDLGSNVRVHVPVQTIKPAYLPKQTRVYRRHEAGRWQVGRVLYHEDPLSLLIQFPNGEVANFEVTELEVRWNKPIADPLPYLIAQATETPFIANARRAFVHEVSTQNSAISGMTGFLSSGIELEDYQFNVVRRVLTDPIQRYLLADEVGLGKTIEACIIIRQYILDEPISAVVVVVVPSALVDQWRGELTQRFSLGGLLDDFLHVVSHDNISRLRQVLPSAGLIVVDEAHHLSRQTASAESELYGLLQSFATKVPRLLLLSATPVLSDSAGFLRVMHLLDPIVFPLEDVVGFQRRLESRQMVAEVVSTLIPENLWSISDELDRLSTSFSGDDVLNALVGNLRQVVQRLPDEKDEEFVEALGSLKLHLAETYRLHRRVLRNRRTAVPWATINRSGVEPIHFDSGHVHQFAKKLDDFRLQVSSFGNLDSQQRATLLQWSVQPNSCHGVQLFLESIGVTDTDAIALSKQLEFASRALNNADARNIALTRAVMDLLQAPGLQVVVFCSSTESADRVYEVLQGQLYQQVQRHEIATGEDDEFDVDLVLPWHSFLFEPGICRVLVCDARAEEGINLHGGKKVAFHFDLPLSPNRIEQRLGRLDRYGTGEPVRSYVLLDKANPAELAWLQILENAWGVFNQSVASLQYLIDETIQQLTMEWLETGLEAFASTLQVLAGPAGRVRKELLRINQQDALDALERPDDALFDQLSDNDANWQEWRSAFLAFALRVLMFTRHEEPNPQVQIQTQVRVADEIFRIGYVYRGNQPTLLPLNHFLKVFMDAVDVKAPGGHAGHPRTYRYAFQRKRVTAKESLRRNVRLLRIGDPMVTALERFCDFDDRGRAFGLWRVRPDFPVESPDGADLYFRFDFVTRPGQLPTGQEDPVSNIRRNALSRLAGAALPPLFFTVWINGAGKCVDDPPKVLLDDYKDDVGVLGNRDFNLNPTRWKVLQQDSKLVWLRDWQRICARARDVACEFVLHSDAFTRHVLLAVNAADSQRNLRITQSRARTARMSESAANKEAEELRLDETFYSELRDALLASELRLEDVGAIFLAQHSPF